MTRVLGVRRVRSSGFLSNRRSTGKGRERIGRSLRRLHLERLEDRRMLSFDGFQAIFNPNWNITLSSYGYADLLFDNTPGFEGREYLSGEWGAAVSYERGDSGPVPPTWLEPDFLYPDWTTNSDFVVIDPITAVGGTFAPDAAVSVIGNGDLEITQRFQMIDTLVGMPMGIAPTSQDGTGAFVSSNRYVLQHTYEVKNVSDQAISNLQLFQFLHGLNSHTGLYDDRDYPGPLSEYRYDTTQIGVDHGFASWSSIDVVAQMFDADGVLAGAPVTLTSESEWLTVGDAVAFEGGFAVAWIGGYGGQLFVQSFDLSGQPIGDAQLVLEFPDGWISDGNMIPLEDGFAAVWLEEQYGGDPLDTTRLVAQFFDVSGAMIGESKVLSESVDDSSFFSVHSAPLSDGFVVAWWETDAESDLRLVAQQYDLTGAPLAEPLVVAEYLDWDIDPDGLTLSPGHSVLPLGDGFLVTWTNVVQDGGGEMTVMGQAFEADGQALEGPWTLAATTGAPIHRCSAVALGDGFLLTWTEWDVDDDQPGGVSARTFAQRFDASGNPLAAPLTVAESSIFDTIDARSVAVDDGYVVTWRQGEHLVSQRFDLSDNPTSERQRVAVGRSFAHGYARWAVVATGADSFAMIYPHSYATGTLEDYITFHSSVPPSGFENGYFGVEGIDSHAEGKPSMGVHLSIEDNHLSNNDFFNTGFWVGGAQRWELGDLEPGETAVFDVMLSILTGVQIGGQDASGSANGSAKVTGGVDYVFATIVNPGSLFAAFAPVEVNSQEFVQRIGDGQFGNPTFPVPGDYLQLWELRFSGSFDGSVQFTVRYDDALLDPSVDRSRLGIYHWVGSQWEYLGGDVDTQDQTITFTTTSLSAFALGEAPIILGVLGDSLSDEYFEDDEFLGMYDYASNWVEILAGAGIADVGLTAKEANQPGDTWGEPRRTGYAQNWARAGAETADLQYQVPGLIGQVDTHGITHVVVMIGANDFAPDEPTGNPYTASVYELLYHDWLSPDDSELESEIQANLDIAVQAMDQLNASGAKVVVATVPDFGVAPYTQEFYPNSAKRENVTNVISDVNDQLIDLAHQRGIPVVDIFSLSKAIFGENSAPKSTIKIGNVAIQLQEVDTREGTNPTAAYVHDGTHVNTVIQAGFAHVFMYAFNRGYGDSIRLLTEDEFLAHAGIAYGGADTFKQELDIEDFDVFVLLPPVNVPPAIAALLAPADTVIRPSYLTLTAQDVTDQDGHVTQVVFYRDTNGDGTWDENDQSIGLGSSGSAGWTWTGSSAGWPVGQQMFFARAQDNRGAWSEPVAVSATIDISTSWQNPTNPLDVNGDGIVSPLDVLVIINEINQNGSRELPQRSAEYQDRYFFDINDDGEISALDVLVVVNFLNQRTPLAEAMAAVGEGESLTNSMHWTASHRSLTVMPSTHTDLAERTYPDDWLVAPSESADEPVNGLTAALAAESEDDVLTSDYADLVDDVSLDLDLLDAYFAALA